MLMSAGCLKVRVTGADIPGIMTAAAAKGVCMQEISREDYFTVVGAISAEQFGCLSKIVERYGGEVRIVDRKGFTYHAQKWWNRPVFLIGMLLLLSLSVFLPSRILFVRVQGNSIVESQKILEQAAFCGIHFGASRREVRSEKVKNLLLQAVPELQWIGVNTHGCVAEISVTERAQEQEVKKKQGVAHVVAGMDGVIESCTVTSGKGMCVPGEVVTKGQILISGYEDCGRCIYATGASGEVYGKTSRQIQAVLPDLTLKRQQPEKSWVQYGIRIGKKQINFCKDSGIPPSRCVKIVKEYQLMLPGGFVLPAVWIVEQYQTYDILKSYQDAPKAEMLLSKSAKMYLQNQLIAGQILNESAQSFQEEGLWTFTGTYACKEMIGRIRYEEIFDTNGKNN